MPFVKVVIIGYGWLGKLLAPDLTAAGHRVYVTSRSQHNLASLPAGIEGRLLDLHQQSAANSTEFFDILSDAIVLCAVAPGRQSDGSDYVRALQQLNMLLLQANSRAVVHFSSSGIYSGLEGEVDEKSALMLHLPRVQMLAAAEIALQQFQCCITLRLAGLMGPGRHPGNWLANKTLPDPDAPVNVVHAADIIAAIQLMLAQPSLSSACYNLSCPVITSRRHFYQAACLMTGSELAFPSHTASQRRVNPQRFITEFGFKYRFQSAYEGLKFCN
jgi:nucleoside-diphosphate-sugar epimerase